MAYPKLPEWPIIDPEHPPVNHIKIGEHRDKDRLNKLWYFYFADGHLLIVSKTWVQFDKKEPGMYVTGQFEYPIAGVRWFVKTLNRFFLHPDHPNAIPRGDITIEEEVDGEVLGVTRGASYGDVVEGIPGYSFDNLNRFRHSTLSVDDNWCQMFKMGDPWLFDYGLLDLFKEIADRHERGEF
jgi:hypothetical protein